MSQNKFRVAILKSRTTGRGPIIVSTLMLGAGLALAAPGDLDADFGDSGLVSLKFSDHGHAATAVLQQPDGKLIVVGLGDVDLANDDDFIIARLLEDGTLDPGFGTNGVSVVDFAGFFDIPNAAVLQSDGKIVLAGEVFVSDSTSDIGLARFNVNGTLDQTFGTGGWATVDLGGGREVAASLILESGGKLVTAGYTNADGTYRPAFTRLNVDGTPDTTFGTAGATILDFGADESWALDFASQSDGKLVSVGPVTANEETMVGIARLSADGIPDPTFGTNGLLTLESAGGFEVAQAVAIQADDSIVIASSEFVDGADHLNGVLRRRDADGDADNTFGTGGKAVIDLGSRSVFASVIVLSGGMLAVTGNRLTDEVLDLIVSRFTSTGQLDQVFGIDGVATADFGDADVVGFSEGFDLIQQSDGKLVAAGRNFNTGSFALARFDDASYPGRIGLTSTSQFVDEEMATSVSYTVRRTGGKTGHISVDYATVAGSAQPDSDFVATSGTFTWNDGDVDDKTITIDVIDDSNPEGNESFVLSLTSPTGGAVLAASEAITFIQNADGPGVFSLFPLQNFMSRTEGESDIQLIVGRLSGSEGEVSVSYDITNGGSATLGEDFVVSGTLAWADGDAAPKFIDVDYLEDAVVEGTESFQIELTSPTGGATITTSSSGRRNVLIIIDNDSGFVLPDTAVSVNENRGSVQIRVARSGDLNRAGSVDYSTADGTAVAGSDYSVASGTLTWAAGDPELKTIEIPITNDQADENDESFTVSLSNPTGGLALASNPTTNVTIEDNDSSPLRRGSGGGGGTNGFDLLALLGLLKLFAQRVRRIRRLEARPDVI